MTPTEIEELAALYAAGALDDADRKAFDKLLNDGNTVARKALVEFQDATALMVAARVSGQSPSAAFKERIMASLESAAGGFDADSGESARIRPSSRLQGFKFVPGDLSRGWRAMKAPGAYIKLLSYRPGDDYAVVLGRLDPGCSYPPHQHSGSEEIYLLSGDLRMGEHVLHAGDFHHSDPGTSHDSNHSVEGCTLLAVVSSKEVLAQLDLPSAT